MPPVPASAGGWFAGGVLVGGGSVGVSVGVEDGGVVGVGDGVGHLGLAQVQGQILTLYQPVEPLVQPRRLLR